MLQHAPQAAGLLAKLDTAFRDLPIYLLPAAKLPWHFSRKVSWKSEWCAYTGRFLDLVLEDWLEDQGLWAGRGFAAVFMDPETLNAHDFLQIVLHEAAHYLAASDDCTTLPRDQLAPLLPPGAIELAPHQQAVEAREARSGKPEPALPPWHLHEAEWIRAMLHLQDRAWRRGLPWSDRFSVGPAYGLSDGWMYSAGLRAELEARHDQPIRSILQDPPPTVFSNRWQHDTGAVSNRTTPTPNEEPHGTARSDRQPDATARRKTDQSGR